MIEIDVIVSDEVSELLPLDTGRIKKHAVSVFESSEVSESDVNIVFIDDENMMVLNEKYKGRKGPTDVLSFALSEEDTDLYWVFCGDAEGTIGIWSLLDDEYQHSAGGRFVLYINGNYTYYAFNDFNKYPFKANPGDKLNLKYNADTITDGAAWYFNEVWLHHRDSDYKMKLTGGMNGTYYGEPTPSGVIAVYDETLVIPEN